MAEKGKQAETKTKEVRGGLLDHVRLSRTTALWVSALALALAVGIFLRVLPLRWGAYLNEYDPFFFFRNTEYIAKNGFSAWFSWHDTMSWYPMGRDVPHTTYMGNPFSAVVIYWILNAVGARVSVFDTAFYFPVFIATLTCIAAFFVGKDLGGKAVGLFTAVFMAISPSYISRTVVGFFDTENIGIFGMVATALFFSRSLEEKKPLLNRLLYAVAGGLSMGYTFASWGAARYIPSLITLFMVVALLLGRIQKRHVISYSVTMGVGFLIAALVPHLGLSYLMNIENIAAIGVIGLLLIYEVIKTRFPENQARMATVGLVVVGLAAFLVLPYFGIGIPLSSKFLNVLNPFVATNPLYSSVGENRLSSWDSFFGDFGITLFLALIGLYFAVKEPGDAKLYFVLFFLTSIYFAGTLVRLLLVLAFPASLLAAFGLVRVVDPLGGILRRVADSRSKRRRVEAQGMSRGLGALFIILILVTFIPHVQNSVRGASQPGPLASSSFPGLVGNSYPTDWPETLAWLKNSTPPGSVVAAWWDYGYWIETMANRTTLDDGSTMSQQQIVNVANMMMKPFNESLPLMKQYDVDYVLVFNTFNPSSPHNGTVPDPRTEQQYPFGDNAKWPQMARIAGYNLTKMETIDLATQSYVYTPLYTNSTIARLMYQVHTIPHFELAYHSKLNWVLVYKVVY